MARDTIVGHKGKPNKYKIPVAGSVGDTTTGDTPIPPLVPRTEDFQQPQPAYPPSVTSVEPLAPALPTNTNYYEPVTTNKPQPTPLYHTARIQQVVYRGNVFINGNPAPVGTVITTSAGGSATVNTDGLYQIEAMDIPSVEFYVNGYIATPQHLQSVANLRQVDLYAVYGEHAAPRVQRYNQKRKLNPTFSVGLKKPTSKWFKI